MGDERTDDRQAELTSLSSLSLSAGSVPQLTAAQQASLKPSLRAAIVSAFPGDEQADQLLEFLLALLTQPEMTRGEAAQQLKEVIADADDQQVAAFVQKAIGMVRDAVAPTIAPAPVAASTVGALATAPSITNVRAAAAAAAVPTPPTEATGGAATAPTRKRIDRTSSVNPDAAAAGQPAKLIKLNATAKAATATAGGDTVEPAAAAGQPTVKKIIRLGQSSSGADDRKARFGVSSGQPQPAAVGGSSSSAMEVDSSQPSLPPARAAAPASSSAAVTIGGNSIRKLKKPGEKTYTYEDEERDRKARLEVERLAREKRQAELTAASEAAAAKKRIRCSAWPQCRHGDYCEYHHPTLACTAFPACRFGDACMFIHPIVPCRFGVLCANATCGYTHPPGRRARAKAPMGVAALAQPPPNSIATPCKFGANVSQPRAGCLSRREWSGVAGGSPLLCLADASVLVSVSALVAIASSLIRRVALSHSAAKSLLARRPAPPSADSTRDASTRRAHSNIRRRRDNRRRRTGRRSHRRRRMHRQSQRWRPRRIRRWHRRARACASFEGRHNDSPNCKFFSRAACACMSALSRS